MNARSMFLVILALQVCQPAIAGSVFRCEVDGRVELTDRPCQPAKKKAVCPERDGKALSQDALQGQCAAPGSDSSKLPAASAGHAGSRSGADLPTHLALNETSGSPEGKLHTAYARADGTAAQNVGGRNR